MAATKNDRSKAAKLRARKTISPTQRAWLAAYDSRVQLGKRKDRVQRFSAAQPSPSSGQAPVDNSPLPSTSVVHETVPLDGAVSPDAHVWTPTVPPAADGQPAEQPPPGAPQPPPPGAPIVDAAPAQSAGDPVAAKQFAGLIVLIATVGIASAVELASDVPLPDIAKAFVDDPEMHKRALGQVAAAAERLAMKYGFTSVPLADEAIVCGSVAGSVLAYVALQKKKRTTKPHTDVAPVAPRESRGVGAVSPQTPVAMPAHLAEVFAS